MPFLQKRRLHAQIFENDVLKDFDRYSIPELIELQKAIQILFDTSPESAVFYETQVCENYRGCLKPMKTTVEVVAFSTHYRYRASPPKIHIPKTIVKKYVGKRITISPKPGLAIKWPAKVEVAFSLD